MAVNHWIERAESYDSQFLLELVLMEIGVGTSEHLQAFMGIDKNQLKNLISKSRRYKLFRNANQTKEEKDLMIRLVNRQYYELGVNGGKIVEDLTNSKYRKEEIPYEEIPPILAPSERVSELLGSNDVFTRLIKQNLRKDQIQWAGYREVEYVLFDRLAKKLQLTDPERVLFSLPKPTAAFVINDIFGFWLQVDDGQANPSKVKEIMVKYHAFYHVSKENKPLIWITERKEELKDLWLDAYYEYGGYGLLGEKKIPCEFFYPGEETEFILNWKEENNKGESKLNFHF